MKNAAAVIFFVCVPLSLSSNDFAICWKLKITKCGQENECDKKNKRERNTSGIFTLTFSEIKISLGKALTFSFFRLNKISMKRGGATLKMAKLPSHGKCHGKWKSAKGFNENSRIVEDLRRIYVKWKFNYTNYLPWIFFSVRLYIFSAIRNPVNGFRSFGICERREQPKRVKCWCD